MRPIIYLALSRDWADGDTVEIDMPFSIRIERAPDRPDLQAIFWGPDYDVPVDGVETPGTDGLTFLDVVWDQAPFATHGAFVRTVSSTADDFVKLGLLTVREKGAIVSTAARVRKDLDV